MKAIFLCFALFAVAMGQDAVTTTDDLLRGQGELTIGHEFVELTLQINRNIISSYITVVTTQLLDSFMDTYSEIHFIADDTTAEFATLPDNGCVNAVRTRWNLQVSRHGQKLSECLLNSVVEINAWTDYVNTVHHTAQATTNQVQNAGVAMLADLDDFTTRDNLGDGINTRFMLLLRSARPYMDRFETFRASVVESEEEIVRELTQCDRALAASFNIEAREDLERANSCF